MKGINIGDRFLSIPIIQGGMGVGVSLGNLAGTVALEGGLGVISAAQIGYQEEDFIKNPLEANLRRLGKEIVKASDIAKGGMIGLNVMMALREYPRYIEEAIRNKIDVIIAGAGLPVDLPKLVKGSKTKIAPIVSSKKACNIILKLWDTKHQCTPDFVVAEGPEAGGHLGFSHETLQDEEYNWYQEVTDIKAAIKPYEIKYGRAIPLFLAGGVYSGKDIAASLRLGADGVQMGTRFIATHECDASLSYKEAFLKCTKEDISLIKSPVGLPGRAIRNQFVDRFMENRIPVNHCYRCLAKCNPSTIPFCITEGLIQAVRGNIENGLIFCGANAYKINEIISVKALIHKLQEEYQAEMIK